MNPETSVIYSHGDPDKIRLTVHYGNITMNADHWFVDFGIDDARLLRDRMIASVEQWESEMQQALGGDG